MVRKQVYLEERQERKLKRLARATGRTEAEILRAAIDAVADADELVSKLEGAGFLAPPPSLPAALQSAQRSELQATVCRLLGDRMRTLRLSDAVLAERAGARW